ncbi:hypothetical protein NDU88_001715 [Pleurodeles waltl]|uniref:Uncharacterized protein n=1 Tax=Pleurodeles waltl TaxID=8319 RepID=A0AAV7P7M9_PLEWA|nr:hypothetical protein NDU88_001715 [Pleurodeles waltl]
MRVPTQGASRKEGFQVALRAWAEAHLEEDDEEAEPENGPSEDLLPSVGDVTTTIVPPSRPGSSVSEQGLATEERREEREFQLQMASLKIEAQQEERRAEREAQAAERALAEKKLLLAHELSLKELDLKAKQSESSSNGGSIQTGPAGEKKVRIPKNVVPSFVVGDDIDKWLAAYEVALRAHEVPEGQWGNDLEHTTWKEVELRSLLEMLGLPEWVCMTTRSMADREGSQGRLEPGTMAQTTAKRRGKGRGKPDPEVPAVVDGVPEEEASEPTGEDIAALGDLPELAGWQVEGGPTREEFCKAQK